MLPADLRYRAVELLPMPNVVSLSSDPSIATRKHKHRGVVDVETTGLLMWHGLRLFQFQP